VNRTRDPPPCSAVCQPLPRYHFTLDIVKWQRDRFFHKSEEYVDQLNKLPKTPFNMLSLLLVVVVVFIIDIIIKPEKRSQHID